MSRANEPAYPVPGLQADPDFNGLSVREHFAAMAMQGLVTHHGTIGPIDLSETALRAVQMADALLAELAKERP